MKYLIILILASCIVNRCAAQEAELYALKSQWQGKGMSVDKLQLSKGSRFIFRQGSDTLKLRNPAFRQKVAYAPASIVLAGARFTDLNIDAPDWALKMSQDTFRTLSFKGYPFTRGTATTQLDSISGNKVQIYGGRVSGSPFGSFVQADSLLISQDTIGVAFDLYGFNLPRFISLTNLTFDTQGVLNLSAFSYYDGQKCSLYISAADISKIKLNYALFDLDTHYMNIPQKEALYKQLLVNQDLAGYKYGYQKADVELKQLENGKDGWFGKASDWLQRNWNYYGYKKEKIFVNALLLFGLFFLINLSWYGAILKDGYTIETIKDGYNDLPRKSTFRRGVLYVFYCAYYTGVLFWGIKIDPEKLKLKTNALLALWVLFQYTVGIIVLAYIANIIIGK